MARKIIWTISTLVTVLLLAWLCYVLFSLGRSYNPDSEQLVNPAAVKLYLKKNWEELPHSTKTPPIYIPTGVFIESLEFKDANEVNITGYVWQHYSDELKGKVTQGFVFPEAREVVIKKAYSRRDGNATVIGWYFEGDFIQSFKYKKFPLDHKTVWIRIWHKDFDKNIILTPDLASYESTKPRDKFGLDGGIVLEGYTLKETFFKYNLTHYDTNFGIKNYIGQKNFPELYYNVVLKRHMLNAFVAYVLPLFAVTMLAFFTMLIVSSDQVRNRSMGGSLSLILRMSAFLLLVVLVSHVQLRGLFAGSDIVYLEYFYFIAYLTLVYLTVNAFVVYREIGAGGLLQFMHYEDNLIPKALFMPLIFGTALFVTYMVFW